jgi:uncharacterized protein with NRDE domain
VCILIALRRDTPDAELWIAANRDERLDRRWLPPREIVPEPCVFGGIDLVGGGSWLATNVDAGYVVAVTNARLRVPAGERSRGQLVLDLASQVSMTEAAALLGELDLSRYGPFNVLIAGVGGMWTASNTPEPALHRVEGPLSVIGNEPLDHRSPRLEFAAREAGLLLERDATTTESGLRTLLADHEGEDPLCRHGQGYGTVCATILTLAPEGVRRYLFAAGLPCRTPFVDMSDIVSRG